MADWLITVGDLTHHEEHPRGAVPIEKVRLGSDLMCAIYGHEGTYSVVRDGEDAIIALGYVGGFEGGSLQETLVRILGGFQESQIGDLKKKLVGEYLLLVKKGPKIFLLSDFMGVRNLFYSQDGRVLSSSFSRIEDALGTRPDDLDPYKVVEYIAMRTVLYAAWLGSSTYHRRIHWLLPYEYLVRDAENGGFKTGSIVYSIDNTKQRDCRRLANDLVSILGKIVARPEFKTSKVAASLTGGHDSRLIAALACREYPNIHFRTAASSMNPDARRDLKVARKLARLQQVPLDEFWFQSGRDEERFRDLTEEFSPLYNMTIAPLLDGAGAYALGFGGVFGTELFMELPYKTIDEYIDKKLAGSRESLKMEDGFWRTFREAIREEFRRIRSHYVLTTPDERDDIRLFGLIDTARYGSFILSAFNRKGYQIDPYGNFEVLSLALRIPPKLSGNHRRFGGNSLVQKAAMDQVNPLMGKLMSYKHFRPMLPLSIRTWPKYFAGFVHQVGGVLIGKLTHGRGKPQATPLPGGAYLSDGWEAQYLGRIKKRYGLPEK